LQTDIWGTMMLISFPGVTRTADGTPRQGATPPALQQLRAYWEALREDALPPLRSIIDPRGIEAVLGTAFILERVAPGIARFRIAGSDLSDLAGCDPRGMPASVLFEARARSHFTESLEQVFTGPAHLDLRIEADRGVGRPALSGQMMILPLRNEAGQSHLALGAMALTGEIGRRTRRFHIGGATITTLAGARADRPEPVAGFAEAATRFADMAPRPYLRLVHTNR
jgi:hypothetical protein